MDTKTDRAIAEALAARLLELSDAVTKGKAGIDREFYMSIPAQPARDADLVMSAAATHLTQMLDERDALREFVESIADDPENTVDNRARAREVLGE